jgi:hypothetical protein
MGWSPSETRARLQDALSRAGIPPDLSGEFLRFQERYGGRADSFRLNPVTWGIIHESPTWLPEEGIEAEYDQEAGIWDVACADVHPSDYVSLDEHGRLYWSGLLWYEHYDDHFLGKPSEA